MARVRSRDTTPERTVRRILTDLGYRYRLHRRDLPGMPDIAFIGRRKAMLLGFVSMALSLVALDRLGSLAYSMPLLAVASASWTLPAVNAYPLFVEPIPRSSRGVLAALFLLCMALGGAVGDPLNGALFDLFEGYRPLFVMMAVYTVLASVAVLFVPKGAGEADTGALSEGPARRA